MNNPTRRSFLRTSAVTAASIGIAPHIMLSRDGVPPSGRLQVGLIGCRNKGWQILTHFLEHGGVDCVGLCDVDQTVLDEKTAEVKSKFNQAPLRFKDFRKLIGHPGLDAVIVATPDHWHCLPMVHACQAGLDVYVEKPLANSIEECNIMARAARNYKRVVQVGQQQRSGDCWNALMDLLKGPQFGTLRKVNVWANFNYGVGQPVRPDTPVPDGVDFDMWLGPAPERSFNPNRFHGSWRMFWDYGGGLMTDWGVHLIDMALWGGDITQDPSEVYAFGRNLSFSNYDHETYDTMSVVFPNRKYVINWQHTAGVERGPYDMGYGLEFIGDNGTVVANRMGWKVYPEKTGKNKPIERSPLPVDGYARENQRQSMVAHVANFISCVKTREQPACPVDTGRQVAIHAHMANIAVRCGAGKLLWNSARGQFSNSEAANTYIAPVYRKPWNLPKV